MTRVHIIAIAVLIPSVILHEVSHGVVALFFGDDTAKRAGRITLNPFVHVDPFGTIILPAILILTTGAGFGYAKPVPVNPRNLHNPRQQAVFVSLAGPVVNILLAVGAALAVHRAGVIGNIRTGSVWEIVFYLGYINVILAAFNLIPIPPLDGSAVIERFLPQIWWPRYMRFRQYSFGILLIVVLVFPDTLSGLFDSALRLWSHLL